MGDEPDALVPDNRAPEPDTENINVLAIFQKIEQLELKIEQKIEHLHMPVAVPSADEAAALKERAPEMYELMIDLSRKNADSDVQLARLPFDHAYNLAKRGQVFGLCTILVIFAFCGYLASLGGAGEYIGGILGAANFAALIRAFMATNKRDESRE